MTPRNVPPLMRGQTLREAALGQPGLSRASTQYVTRARLLSVELEAIDELWEQDSKLGQGVIRNIAADLCLKICQTYTMVRELSPWRAPEQKE